MDCPPPATPQKTERCSSRLRHLDAAEAASYASSPYSSTSARRISRCQPSSWTGQPWMVQGPSAAVCGRLPWWTAAPTGHLGRRRRRDAAGQIAAAEVHRPLVENADDHRRPAFEHPPGDQFVAGRGVAGFQRQQVPAARGRVGREPGRRQEQAGRPDGWPRSRGRWAPSPADRRPRGQTPDGPRARRFRGRRPIAAARRAARTAAGSSPPAEQRPLQPHVARPALLPVVHRHGDAQRPGHGKRIDRRPLDARLARISATTRSRPAASSSRGNSGSMGDLPKRRNRAYLTLRVSLPHAERDDTFDTYVHYSTARRGLATGWIGPKRSRLRQAYAARFGQDANLPSLRAWLGNLPHRHPYGSGRHSGRIPRMPSPAATSPPRAPTP